jgi:hypothetical protein
MSSTKYNWSGMSPIAVMEVLSAAEAIRRMLGHPIIIDSATSTDECCQGSLGSSICNNLMLRLEARKVGSEKMVQYLYCSACGNLRRLEL